jgi:sialate O-acetylesterase
MSWETLKENPKFASISAKVEKNTATRMAGVKKPYFQPTVLFNGMINPLPPFPIRGIIWYQGEANRGDGLLYADKMEAMLTHWRALWDSPDLPFYFVQIAPFKYTWGKPETLLEIWEAQNAFVKRVPNTGMTVINDLADLADIHPKNKAPVGKRLAALALNKTYGMTDLPCESPTVANMSVQGNKASIAFDHAAGLKTRDGEAPTCFELAGEDGQYHPAQAVIDGNRVVLSSPKVETPVAVKFAWNQTALPNLINAAGLPAGPFRANAKSTQR